jgi:hypothetical protein
MDECCSLAGAVQEGAMKIHTAAVALALLGLAYSPAAVWADESGQTACMQDAISICGQFIPNREQVAACLISNRRHVSPACRSALTHFKTASSR